MKRLFPQLAPNNVLFGRYYHEEFDALEKGELFHENTVYLHISSKLNPADAPVGCENWKAMINAPLNTGQTWDKLVAIAREQVQAKLGIMLNENIHKDIVCEHVMSPVMFEQNIGSYAGAIHGNTRTTGGGAILGFPYASPKYKNLYFVGGSVNPGGGMPMVTLSGQLVRDKILADLGK